jgi:hypothetical protein
VSLRARHDVTRRLGDLEERLGGRGRCGCIELKSPDDFPADQLDPDSGKQFHRFLWEPCPDHIGYERRAWYTYWLGDLLPSTAPPKERVFRAKRQAKRH